MGSLSLPHCVGQDGLRRSKERRAEARFCVWLPGNRSLPAPQGRSQRGVWKLHRASQSGRETIGSPDAGIRGHRAALRTAGAGARAEKARVARTPGPHGWPRPPFLPALGSARGSHGPIRPGRPPGVPPPPAPPLPGVWPGAPSRSRPGRTSRAAAGTRRPPAPGTPLRAPRPGAGAVPGRDALAGGGCAEVGGRRAPRPPRSCPQEGALPGPPSPPRHSVS